jgi:hypothetical protein
MMKKPWCTVSKSTRCPSAMNKTDRLRLRPNRIKVKPEAALAELHIAVFRGNENRARTKQPVV